MVNAVVKKWGNSYGIILPIKIVRDQRITENDVIDVKFNKKIKPIAIRTYSEYCNKLIDMGLIEAKRAAIQGKVREFS